VAVEGPGLGWPPLLQAAACAWIVGGAGILSALLARGRFRFSGMEAGLVAAIVVMAGTLLVFFRSVATQNSLDDEVLHNSLGVLVDYALLIAGISVLSSRRAAYVRMAVVLGVACLVRMAWHHMAPAE